MKYDQYILRGRLTVIDKLGIVLGIVFLNALLKPFPEKGYDSSFESFRAFYLTDITGKIVPLTVGPEKETSCKCIGW